MPLIALLCGWCSRKSEDKTMKSATEYLKELQSWYRPLDVSIESLASLRSLYVANALENLKSNYDGSPLEAIVVEINQNNSISIWVETTKSRQSIASRFRSESNGYEGKSDSEILESITPWYYDAFEYACLEFTCTGDFKKLAEADIEFCERSFDEAEDASFFSISRDATIEAIIQLEKVEVLTGFNRSPEFDVRIFSDENDTISPGEYCWASNNLLVKARQKPKS